MARPLRGIYPGPYYHVLSRDNEQKEIFKSQKEREKFLEFWHRQANLYGAVIQTYCLISDHYHLLLETPEEGKQGNYRMPPIHRVMVLPELAKPTAGCNFSAMSV